MRIYRATREKNVASNQRAMVIYLLLAATLGLVLKHSRVVNRSIFRHYREAFDQVWSIEQGQINPESSPTTDQVLPGQDADFYQSFWDRSLQLALESKRALDKMSAPDIADCPKVFVFNLSSDFRDVTRKHVASVDYAFGNPTAYENPIEGISLRSTNQYSLGTILENRLRQPESCYYTNDPAKADLFYLPINTAPKGSAEVRAMCEKSNVTQLLEEIRAKGLEPDCRYFMTMGKGHYIGRLCTGWFWDPLPVFQPAMRLAYSHAPAVNYFKVSHVETDASEKHPSDQAAYPNLFSVPYPSSLHYLSGEASNFLANTTEQRKYLMSFVGKWDHGDVEVRLRIRDLCLSYNDNYKCKLEKPSTTNLLVKRSSTFCLEPVGDSPWRKSIADSISFGCIPVLFSNDTDNVTPWFWDHWKHHGRILLGEEYREAFLSGRIDLYQLLSTIPPRLLTLMQDTVAKYCRQYQYSLTDDHGDGVHLALEKMKSLAKEKQRQGICGGAKELP